MFRHESHVSYLVILGRLTEINLVTATLTGTDRCMLYQYHSRLVLACPALVTCLTPLIFFAVSGGDSCSDSCIDGDDGKCCVSASDLCGEGSCYCTESGKSDWWCEDATLYFSVSGSQRGDCCGLSTSRRYNSPSYARR